MDSRGWAEVAAAPPASFGEPLQELATARDGAIACPLARYAVLDIRGEDAREFLQGQLTCDVAKVGPTAARFGGHCTPQGRLLATLLLVGQADGYRMLLAADLADAIAARLRKYVLRARVRIEREAAVQAIGIGGPQSAAAIGRAVGTAPMRDMEAVLYASALFVRLPGDLFVVLAPAADLPALWALLSREARPCGTAAWEWLQVRAGIPWITAATQDQFVPQMAGLDALGGVSFDKGCYPGQEIVARTHYLGEVKRRLRRGHSPAPAQAGDLLLAQGQNRAVVLNAAPAPQGGHDLLAVVQDSAGDRLSLRSADGPSVALSAAA
ncbi:MAG TPA: folate-binding protein [Burkholderiales bacterium]|jgi:folate-binding protein YgfZ|nr:folate-binding protein [Burkholderiales bacterium]